ncbi:hypothetical protein KAZ57_00040 [Patescibacteria group bacterium]|nr:hypothetical protein [Patescibacteria group bacterium]
MLRLGFSNNSIDLAIPISGFKNFRNKIAKHFELFLGLILIAISIYSFYYYYKNGLGIAYNDARSHLDIGRRVVEGLKPGLAQLGSVWLPLPHLLMGVTIWNDFMWHSGLAGAIISMISFVGVGFLIYLYLRQLKVGVIGRILGVLVFASNINILYLQSTAMTELLLLFTMTFAAYELLKWYKNDNILYLIKSAFWIMLATLVRYDGWFLLAWVAGLVALRSLSTIIQGRGKDFWANFGELEGKSFLFLTLGSFGIALWLLWNLLIFKDPFFFAFGPFSAKAQQDQLQSAGVLQTKHNVLLSIKFYFYALAYNTGTFTLIFGLVSYVGFLLDKLHTRGLRIASTALIAPAIFNIVALYLGHSVLFIQGLSGDTWFNVRYGIMMLPAIAIFLGYVTDRLFPIRNVIIGLLIFVTVFSFTSYDAVTIDDALVGSSQKNVSEVSGWLKDHATYEKGYILISAASHDAIIFSSGLPMKRFIHEGTGLYWKSAIAIPDRWARWIVVRTYDDNDLTWKGIKENTDALSKYALVAHFPFADVYELRPEFLGNLHFDEDFKVQK